ncbi:peptide-methionine (R)-S-oxide reductase MsrB [Lacinutrix sp. Bg11-31]|uniref:peptide-methionine (R)-S-oxide reductase MsrB n=1 Tax=Lacinutrix sp. Bg11-31 TaxID=2057808 RepID=UPI000C30F9B8|nr:peptide-methionine (R)-S-oxide reductase MsrB [Lacinutrix sp. Bg11-31]AUC81653.1 peptide-methionine (R)-S-oxide reductase [Lacinutrix sp. Bg11-31]
MRKLILLSFISVLFSCNSSAQKNDTEKGTKYPVTKTDSTWKKELSKKEYYVLREAGTERPFSSKLNKEYSTGIYVCSACEIPLFKSENKFDSGTGWPSFDREIKGNVAFGSDSKLGYSRNEEHCANCGGHLGHVFNDGPKTTGKRHCINGVALKFIPSKDE